MKARMGLKEVGVEHLDPDAVALQAGKAQQPAGDSVPTLLPIMMPMADAAP